MDLELEWTWNGVGIANLMQFHVVSSAETPLAGLTGLDYITLSSGIKWNETRATQHTG